MAFAVTYDFSNGTVADADEVNQNFNDVENQINNFIVPVGGVMAWLKTFSIISSGTTTSTSSGNLVDSGATFITDGVTVGMVVQNTTDTTFTHVTGVTSETQLAVNDDIFVSGENYEIYATPKLLDGYAECNGQVLSDVESPYDGKTLPNLNGSGGGTQRFLRGSIESGITGGSESHSHTQTDPGNFVEGGQTACLGSDEGARNNSQTGTTSTLPSFYEAVWIMRVK